MSRKKQLKTSDLIPDLTVHLRKVEDLIPYARNASTHDDAQIAVIASSIKAYKFRNPIIVTSDGGIKCGHGRVLAARKLGMTEVPCLYADDLTELQLRAYILMDNKTRDLAGTDEHMLGIEFADLREHGYDLALTGYDEGEIESAIGTIGEGAPGAGNGPEPEDFYTKKIQTPLYIPKGENPNEAELCNTEKTDKLLAEITAAKLPAEVTRFLSQAAQRHLVFDYGAIAEYYAHAPAEVQALMERSALVIIDFNAAIKNGFVVLTRALAEAYDAQEE
jgi:hypothetical protein